MKKEKKEIMPPEVLSMVAARFKVLAEPTRLEILQLLQGGELNVSEITGAVNSTQPNVSKHLRILQDAGLVSRRQEANAVFYAIADESVFALCEVVCGSLREKFAERMAALG